MKRIWNALRYGDSQTRKYIGGVILFSVIAVVLIVISGIWGRFTLFLLGMISGIAALCISQSFTLVKDDFVAQVSKDGKKESVRTMGAVKKQKEMSPDKGKESEKEETMDDRERADFSRYNEQLLKKVKKKYRVRKDHRPILIDHSQTYRIRECPAFIWRAHNKVYLLLLEKEPRRICISREFIHHVDYVPQVRANRQKEYLAFQKENLVTRVFEEYLPSYYDSKAKDGNLKYKNLYQIYPDIQITNRSIYQVMDLLYLNFMPEDKITKSDKINGFFKRIYAANILYKDKVYSITEYKEEIEKILDEMSGAQMPESEFQSTLENLVRARFLSQEYADHYAALRTKRRTKA